MIPKLAQKIKLFYENNKNDLFVAVIIFLVGMAGFGLGRLSVLWIPKEPITIENKRLETRDQRLDKENRKEKEVVDQAALVGGLGQLVGSKNGTSYHFPWCPGAQKIKEENKIVFQTREEAESMGYKPAGNCPGL